MNVATNEILDLIQQQQILHFEHLFSIGKVQRTIVYQELSCKPSRLTYYINHPDHLRIRDIRLIGRILNVHYLVILRLVDRQLEDKNFRLKRFYPSPVQ